MEDTPVENDLGKRKVPIWLIIGFCFIILIILPFFPCPFEIKIFKCISLSLRVCLLLISLCWICALLVVVITNRLFSDGVSQNNLYIIRLLCQCAMLMVITGLLLILLVCIKVLFF